MHENLIKHLMQYTEPLDTCRFTLITVDLALISHWAQVCPNAALIMFMKNLIGISQIYVLVCIEADSNLEMTVLQLCMVNV